MAPDNVKKATLYNSYKNAKKMYLQYVDRNYQYVGGKQKIFSMIDNYVYLYHTKTLIVIPTFPDSINDNLQTTFASDTPLARSAPIYAFSNAGPREFQVTLSLHRDMMDEINTSASRFIDAKPEMSNEDYTDQLIKELHGAALPRYATAEKMVDPPLVAVRFGNEIFCKGVVNGGISVTYSGPILETDKYAQVEISFTISEVDPYDADAVMLQGGFRGFSSDLERKMWVKK